MYRLTDTFMLRSVPRLKLRSVFESQTQMQSCSVTARPTNQMVVANSEKKNSTLFTKTDPLQFQLPSFYISKLRISVCICKTSQTLKPQPCGKARSLQLRSHIKKYIIRKRAHSRDILPQLHFYHPLCL